MSRGTIASDIFSGFWWESVKPLQYYTATYYRFHILQTKENCCSGKNWPYITTTFWYLFHGYCKTAFMPLAACMILQQCRLQLVKLSRPFGLSLLRLFERFLTSLYRLVYFYQFTEFHRYVCKLCFFIVVCLFCILFFSYCCLLGVLN